MCIRVLRLFLDGTVLGRLDIRDEYVASRGHVRKLPNHSDWPPPHNPLVTH